MNNISLLLLTHNNENEVSSNLNWLKLCPSINEIINVDDNSTDNTLESLTKLNSKSLAVKSYSRSLNADFSSQRNFGVSKCSHKLILWLDSDEVPSCELVEFINHIDTNQHVNYSFKRLDTFLDHQLNHGENYNQYFTRLILKDSGKFTGKVHEIWQSSLPTKPQNINILHQSHKTLTNFIEKINYYSDIRSQELYENNVTTSILEIIFYPKAKFIANYFWYQGYKDGTVGIIMALGMSFYTFLVRSKLWCLHHP